MVRTRQCGAGAVLVPCAASLLVTNTFKSPQLPTCCIGLSFGIVCAHGCVHRGFREQHSLPSLCSRIELPLDAGPAFPNPVNLVTRGHG